MNRHARARRVMLFAFALCAVAPMAAQSEPVGTSCADCPSYRGAFSLENSTGTTVNYVVRWGTKNPWKRMSLANGKVTTHSYPLGEDRQARIPPPYVRFDRIGGDNAITNKDYKMQFHAVGYAGYGPKVNRTEPKRYAFRYTGTRYLDIVALR